MSKKKLTKKKKKQLLTLFATTSMTVNMMVMPVTVLANNSSNSTDIEKNGELILGENEIIKDVLPDNFNSNEETGRTDLIAEDNNKNSSEATNGLEEVDTSDINTEKNQTIFSGSYDDAGFWKFDQGVLTLNGGTLAAATGENSWLKYIAKTDVQEIRVMDAVGAADLSGLFNDYTNVKKITFDRFDTSRATTMAHMFSGCTNLTSLDLSSFDTSQVMDMSYMVNACSSLTEINLSNFDTSKVTTMYSMFGNCRNLTKLDLSSFNTAKVTTMENMFYECNNLVELDLSEFDTSRAPTMYSMFYQCGSLERVSLGRQTKLSTSARLRSPSNVEFWYDASGKKVLNTSAELIQYHDKGNKTTTYTIGSSAYEDNGVWRFQDGVLTLTDGTLNSNAGVTGITTTTGTNTWLRFLNIDDIQEIRVVNAIGGSNLSSFFSSYAKVEKITFDNFDTSQTGNFSSMFSNCSSLKNLDLSDFDTSNAYMMSNMFSGCTSLIFLDLSSFDTGKLYSGSGTNSMFSGCDNLEKLNLGNLMTLAVNMNLKTLGDSEFWHGKLEDNYLDTSADLITYHNNLKETNIYTLINSSEEIVTLTFDTMGGSEISAIETNFGSVWIEPTTPTKEGHSFMGWYTDEEYTAEFDFATPATESTTIYAKWAEDKEEVIFETDDYYIGDYNITGRFNAPIVTAQLRIDGEISNRGGTFNQTDGTFHYYAGAGRIQTGQDVVLEGLDSAGNIVETVKIEPKIVAGSLDNVQYTLGESTIAGEYTGNMSKARLVVNGTIVSVGGTFKDGVFSYYVNPSQLKETDTIQMQGYDAEGNPVGDLTPVSVQKQSGQLLEANYIMGQTTVNGKYEGNVKKGCLIVDGKPISWGGTFKDGIFSYYVAPGTIKADSVVELAAYGDGDVLLTEENFVVNIQE